MGFADDILKIPDWLKILLGFGILLGATIELPLINIPVGAILFAPFTLVLSFLGINISFELFVILFGVILLLLFARWAKGLADE